MVAIPAGQPTSVVAPSRLTAEQVATEAADGAAASDADGVVTVDQRSCVQVRRGEKGDRHEKTKM